VRCWLSLSASRGPDIARCPREDHRIAGFKREVHNLVKGQIDEQKKFHLVEILYIQGRKWEIIE